MADDEDRAGLLARARAFLASPQVQLQDSDARRAFLADKGLTPAEVEQLLRESPPSVPPRTYPAPPPSTLPNLLAGIARVFTSLTGASALVLFVYYKFLLPRLARSYQARLSLHKHQFALIARITESASALRAAQAESYKDLPRTIPVHEDPQYAECHTLDELVSRLKSSREESTPPGANISVLRCALEDLGRPKPDGISTEELFQYLESRLPWLTHEDGPARQSDLWDQLNACPLFVSSLPKSDPTSPPSRLLWKYAAPPHPPTPPLFTSLAGLQAALSRGLETTSTALRGSQPASSMSPRQRMLQILSDMTGYITTQTYSLGLPSLRGTNGVASSGNSLEDELRRDIRALKSLVLSRRSFLPLASDSLRSSEA